MASLIRKGIPLPAFLANNDIMVAVGVIAILMIMIIPLPTPLLDLLLAFNITFSLMIILVAMYTLKALDFSVFPSILLVATLFRLSLNVASTRLILLYGNEGPEAAGRVIKAFGTFVVGGNYVVGMVVFLILVVINFVVITKGSGRIAEVAARFTLDAMPGKQMSIDADLNAGLISEDEARRRRMDISREADFYGAMDGASKFVRGDAIAGIIITLINILGGLIIGVLQKGMSLSRATQNYTLLTIGDGLVSQIPALIVSTAAGIVVSRAASDSTLGKDMIHQMALHPRAMGIAAAILCFMAMVPGLPMIPFLVLGLSAAGLAYTVHRSESDSRRQAEMEEASKRAAPQPERVEALLPLDLLELEVGYGLIPLVDTEQDGELLERIKSIRRQFALEMGMVIPPMHIRDNLQLRPNEYSILIKGVRLGQGELLPDHYLAMDPGGAERTIEGIPTKEPAFGLPAIWIQKQDKEKAQMAGYTVVDLSTVVATHISEVVKAHAHEMLGRQEVQKLIDQVAKDHPKVVEELIPGLLSLGEVVKVLQNLLKESVSIRDLLTILETLADYAPTTKNTHLLTEYVRQSLSRSITKNYLGQDETLSLISLQQEVEDIISNSIQHTERESYLSIEPRAAQKILMEVSKEIEKFSERNLPPIVLCSPSTRIHFKKLTERFIPNLTVLSHNEIASDIKINTIGTVSLHHADQTIRSHEHAGGH